MEYGDSDVELSASSTYQRTYIAKYYGRALVERWHTQPMLSWIIAEIKRLGAPKSETVFLSITDNSLKGVSVKYGRLVFEHKISSLTKFNQLADAPKCFAYLTKEGTDVSLCHAFQAADELSVFQLFTVLKDVIQETNRKSPLKKKDQSCDPVQTKQCQQYEVLYVGKIRVPQKRGTNLFVDNAVQRLMGESSSKGSPTSLGSLSLKDELEIKGGDGTTCVPEVSLELSSNIIPHPLLLDEDIKPSPPQTPKKSKLGQTQSVPLGDHPQTTTLAPPPSTSLITHSQSLDTSGRESLVHDIHALAFNSEQFSSVIEDGSLHRQTSLPPMNAKTFLECSLGFPLSREISSHSLSDDQQHDNRTMLFLIGPNDICLISTDKKELLFRKDFPDISYCGQGENYSDYFGIICRETTMTGIDTYVGYIFQCQSGKIVDEIMKTLKQSFHCALKLSQEKRSPKSFNFCETCPMHWFHRLCSDIEGVNQDQVQPIIMLSIAALSEKEQRDLMSKYQEISIRSPDEQNIVFMMLLRALCEQKQMKHSHTVIKTKKEKSGLSPLNSLTSLAKGTFRSSFESVFKEAPLTKAYSLPPGSRLNHKLPPEKKRPSPIRDLQAMKNISSAPKVQDIEKTPTPIVTQLADVTTKDQQCVAEKPLIMLGPERGLKDSSSLRSYNERSLSDTAAVLWELHQGEHQIPHRAKESLLASSDAKINELPRAPLKASPLRNIFLKVGTRKSNFPLKEIREQHNATQKGSWRKTLFNKVQSPFAKDTIFESTEEKKMETIKHSSTHLKALWKKAIMEQIMLIRMEREQKKLQMKQDKILEKHIKLDYEVISPSPQDALQKWEEILNSSKPEHQDTVTAAVKYGVPRQKRGEIWCFLVEHYCQMRKCNPPEDVPYNELLKKLTPYQHAILIDIGRTYPTHPFFKQVLGPGQLSLFSLLKAYSVADEEVGYCQGLSFLGGILLLHMEEEKAFRSMKHIMFTLGLRNQFKSDMAALQVQMYQLARLIQTMVPDIHELFEKLDVSPVLYAAPWFLTLFAAHFPVGFVARLLDMVFLQGLSVIFKVSVLLLKTQQSQILKCTSFESMVSFLKSTLPSSGYVVMEKVLDQVLSMDIDTMLQTYYIEYMVLKEEMAAEHESDIEPKEAHKLESENKELQKMNNQLSEQLQVCQNTVSTLQASVTSYQSTIRKLESHVSSLQDERDALHHSVNVLRKRLESLESSLASSPAKDSDVLASPPPVVNVGLDETD